MDSAVILYVLSIVIASQIVVLGLFINIAMGRNDKQQEHDKGFSSLITKKRRVLIEGRWIDEIIFI